MGAVSELLLARRDIARQRDETGHAVDAARAALERSPSLPRNGLARAARRLLVRTLDELEGPPSGVRSSPEMIVGPQAHWLELPSGRRLELAGALLRTFVRALSDKRLREPGEPLTVQDLITIAWPDERMLPRAGKLRVWNVITRLRNLGLRDVLVTRGDGYMIDERMNVKLA
jgi:hypothetical protein